MTTKSTKKPVYGPARLLLAALTLLSAAACLPAGPRDPFPAGYCMMSQGAITDAEGAAGREPWTPAAFYRDSLRWGASAAAVSYHGGGAAAQYAAGGFGLFRSGTIIPIPVVCKMSLMQLNAMGIYYEQTLTASAGISWRLLSFSIDAQSYRTGLYGYPQDARTSAAIGASLLAQTSRISADVAVSGLTVMGSGFADVDPAPAIAARVCTARNRYGSQGAMMRVTPGDDAPVRFVIAQEYRIGNNFALSASIASNPTTIGFGIAVSKSPVNGAAAVVNHPFLGWSKGVAVDYSR